LYSINDSAGRAVLLSDRTASEQPAAGLPPAAAGHVEITEHRANRVAIEVESETGGRLLLRDLAYPGWHVTIDGTPAEPTRLWVFRTVDVPPGEHTVVWSYRPRSVYWGAGISVAALVVLIGTAALRIGIVRKQTVGRTSWSVRLAVSPGPGVTRTD
ncbi:MAG: YfhO family protein, partial [Planctomycetaceae bacterium]